jgi:hypothetical protein
MKKTSLTLALLATFVGGIAGNALAQEKKADTKPEARAAEAKAPESKSEPKASVPSAGGSAGNAAIVNNKPISKRTLDEFMAAKKPQISASRPSRT